MTDTNPTTDLAARLEAALTERFTELGNPFSEMRRHEQGPDGWPASHPVGPHQVAEVLRELLAAVSVPASAPTDRTRPSTCPCGTSPDPGICQAEHDGLQAGGHCTCAHTGKPAPVDQTALRGLIAKAVRTVPIIFGEDNIAPVSPQEAGRIAAAVLADVGPLVDRLRRERDLAIAHDRQPYPTAWAYEQACAALRRKTETIERVRNACDQLRRAAVLADGQPHTDRERGVVQAVTRITAALDTVVSGPRDTDDTTGQAETQAFICKCPAEICQCGHHAVVSQPAWDACTCATAGDGFAPTGHYADCPAAEGRQALPRPEGPEYTPCLCGHIQPDHEPTSHGFEDYLGACNECDDCRVYYAPPAADGTPS